MGRLTTGMAGVAAALHCRQGAVRTVLRAREDHMVPEALPPSPISTELEQALVALDTEIQQQGERPI